MPLVISADPRRTWPVVVGAVVAIGLTAWAWLAWGQPDDPVLAPPGSPELPGDPARVPLDGFGEIAVTVDPGDGRGFLSWCLLAAMEAAQRARGLMEVTDLQGYAGMAFVYEEDTTGSFYMRNTPTPLSIAFIAADGAVVSTTDMAPCEDRDGCPTYPPGGPYRTAIEVFQGGLPVLGIVEGATVSVGGACAPTDP